MVKRLLLLIGLFCSVTLYGQKDYVLEKRDTGFSSFYKIEAPDAWEQRNVFVKGKKLYMGINPPSVEYWQKLVKSVRQTYIPPQLVQKMVEAKTTLSVHFVFDHEGNMIDVRLMAGAQIFQFLTKKQLVEIYRHFWTIKVPVSNCFGSDQYFQGQMSLLPIEKKEVDWESLKKRHVRLKESDEPDN